MSISRTVFLKYSISGSQKLFLLNRVTIFDDYYWVYVVQLVIAPQIINLLLTECEGCTGELKWTRGRGSTDPAKQGPYKNWPRANVPKYGLSKLG